MPEHTTMPWDDETAVAIKKGDPRVQIMERPMDCDARILSEANYQHAKHCVNALPAVLDALRALFNAINGDSEFIISPKDHPEIMAALPVARAAHDAAKV